MFKLFHIAVIILVYVSVHAQVTQDTLSSIEADSIMNSLPIKDTLPSDSIINIASFRDSFPIDTNIVQRPSRNVQNSNQDYALSKDAIEKEIVYSAIDSNVTDVINKEITLYTQSKVEYEKVTIEADKIVINFQENTAKGFAKRNNNGDVIKRASFSDQGTNGTYHELAYNFNSSKAFVKNLKTKEGEFNILGEQSKYIAAKNDTLANEDKFFNRRAVLTTCNLDHPHFGIRTKKMKFIPDKLAVMGPSQLVLAGVPTPIILPYGFLPLIKGQSSGLIFPSDYEYNEQYGFGLREIGYYFPINDYFDLKVTGDIYTRGSHGIRVGSNYKKRYAYNGSVNLSYSNFLEEDTEGVRFSTKAFSINLRHNQDAKAHPYRTIGGSINISGNQYNRRNNFDAESALKNIYRSSFSYNYNFPDSPFKISTGIEHSQNTNTNEVNITLPTANLTMRTIQPFKRKNQTGDTRWYEEINLGYRAGLKNSVRTTDTTLFEQETLDNLVTGFNHQADLSFNTRVLKYFTVSPSVTYNEIYNLKKITKRFDPTLLLDTTVIDSFIPEITVDTTFGQVIEELENQLNGYRNYNIGVSVNTQLFGTKRFRRGPIRGIRHIIKPTVSFNYTPDTRSFYQEEVDTDTRPEFNEIERYSPFPSSPYAANLTSRSMSLNYSLNNTLEAKYYSKKDSVEKNIKLLENWRVSGNYNFAADSMHWSNVSISGNTRLFNGISTIDLRMVLTPYELFRGTQELNEYLVDNKKFPLQMKSLRVGFNSNLTIKKFVDILKGKEDNKANDQSNEKQRPLLSDDLPSLTSLIENFRLSHNYVFNIQKTPENRDTFIAATHTIGINGNLNLTDNWSVQLGNISYNLLTKKMVYPTLSFQRDLHCWTMSFGWYPSSKVYNFFIGVKSSSLSFLKYDYGQNTFGGGRFGG